MFYVQKKSSSAKYSNHFQSDRIVQRNEMASLKLKAVEKSLYATIVLVEEMDDFHQDQ